MRTDWVRHAWSLGACCVVLAACSGHVASRDAECDAPRVSSIPSGSAAVGGLAPRILDVVLVNDTIAVWRITSDDAVRRTLLGTGCTMVIARLSESSNLNDPFGGESWRLRPTPPVRAVPIDAGDVPADFSGASRLRPWPGDSVALYDPVARRVTILSVGAPRTRRAFVDTSRVARSPIAFGELDDPRYDATYWPGPTPAAIVASNAAPESATVETSGAILLRDRAAGRDIARLPVRYMPTLTVRGALGPMMVATPALRGSLVVVGGSRVAATNERRDSISIADVDGRQWHVQVPLPPVTLSAADRAARKAAWIRSLRQLPRDAIDSVSLAQLESLVSVDEHEPSLLQLFQRDSTTFVVYRDMDTVQRPAQATGELATIDTLGGVRRCVSLRDASAVLAIGRRVVLVVGKDSATHRERLLTLALPSGCAA